METADTASDGESNCDEEYNSNRNTEAKNCRCKTPMYQAHCIMNHLGGQSLGERCVVEGQGGRGEQTGEEEGGGEEKEPDDFL